MNNIILDTEKIDKILKRIALQIIENCHKEESIQIVGIKPRGPWVAEQIAGNIKKLKGPKTVLSSFAFDDQLNPTETPQNLEGKTVILADDILNSGATMMMAASLLMQMKPKQIYTASLIDRQHRRYPVHCDFTGLSLATTMNEHLKLSISPKPKVVLQ